MSRLALARPPANDARLPARRPQPDRLGSQHREDHERDGDGRGGAAAPRRAANRGAATLCVRDPPDDAGSCRRGAWAAAAADPHGARASAQRWSAAHRRRPRIGRRLQLQHRPRRGPGRPRARRRGTPRCLFRLRQEGRLLSDLPRPRARRELYGLLRPALVCRRPRDRRARDGRLRRRRGRPRGGLL